MTDRIEWARNTKTGNTGIVVCRYTRRDGVNIVQVNVGVRTAYWLASHVEAA